MSKPLRSQSWFGRKGKDGLIYRSWMKNQGIPDYEFNNKPVIGICNTWSELTPCNAHFRELAESVKRGISEAGGFPVEFPVMSLGETLIKPTAMLFRNLASMDVEESIRAEADLAAVVIPVGPGDFEQDALGLEVGAIRIIGGNLQLANDAAFRVLLAVKDIAKVV